MRILVVAVALMVPGLAHGQAPAAVRAHAQVVDTRPSRDALGSALSTRLGVGEGWVTDAGLAVVAGRVTTVIPMDRLRRAPMVEISFLRN